MKVEKKINVSGANSLAAALVSILFCGMGVFAQTLDTQAEAAETPPAKTERNNLHPSMTGYRSVKIGASADEVRVKLGKAEVDDKDGFFYQFSDDEFAQIRLDENGKVHVIAVTYSEKNAPTFTDVFGAETTAETKVDGSIYKRVRYPEAGFWVAYSRTSGERPTITITIQRLWI